jgi:6-phosphogluconate dehydrogenase
MEDIRKIDDLIEKLQDAVAVLTLEDIDLLIRSLETYKNVILMIKEMENEQKTATYEYIP